MLRIATWNVNSIRARLDHLHDWLSKIQPDILALQETKVMDTDFPLTALTDMGYQSVATGQKSYNGVALLSHRRAEDVVTELPDFADPQRRIIAATYGPLRVINVYVPNGASVGSDKYAYKLAWFEKLREFIAAELGKYTQLIILGDFNVAPDDRDVHDPELWHGSVLVSPPERAALAELCSLGLTDIFREFNADNGQFSWWDYRQGAFRRNLGLRIDLILTSAKVTAQGQSCVIDKEPRTWPKPSDHAPVIAEFNI